MKKHLTTVLAALLALSLLFLSACGSGKNDESTAAATRTHEPETFNENEWDAVDNGNKAEPSATEGGGEAQAGTADPSQTTEVPSPDEPSGVVPDETAEPGSAAEVTTAPPVTEPATTAPGGSPYAGYTKADIVNYLSAAVNKTKAYRGNVTVSHKESFTSQVSDVTPGGALTTKAVNFVKDLVLKPSEETYSFSGGTAQTKDGETTQLLLPKDKAFTLTADGVSAAAIRQENGMAHVRVVLVPETVNSLSAVPKYNASAIGYLDLDGKFSVITIKELTINYPGSVIDAYIRSDGYVASVTYTVKMDAYAKASGLGITGSARFSGDQVESWTINW